VAFRCDLGTLRKPVKTSTGLRVDAHITRVGVFEYRNADGSTRLELREDAEVKSPESLASFAMVPVTDNHPPVRLDAANAPAFARGASGENVRADGDRIAAPLTVFDASLIAKLEAGKVQVSCGYDCDLDETPGVHPRFGRYDAIQRNIRGNHIAIVDVGRAGPDVRVRMDGAAMMVSDDRESLLSVVDRLTKDLTMDFEKLYKEAEQRAAAEKVRADKAEGERDAATKRADALEAERDSEKKRADAAEKARTDSAVDMPALVAARVALVETAHKVLRTDGKPDDLSKMSDRAIKVAFVEKVDGDKIPAEKSDDYVDAYFASASKRADAAASRLAQVRTVIDGGARVDTSDDPETAARLKMEADNRAASAPAKA
jgi:hypothetical protein